jgi:3-dehydroquinate dehydratase II
MRLADLRHSDEAWRIAILNGPALTRELAALDDLDGRLGEWGDQLGVDVEVFASNHEGRLLEFIHASSEATDAYIVNPGGLTTVGESLRHALRDSARPHVEVHLDKTTFDFTRSILAPSVTGIVGGLDEFSYLGALVSMVLSLDDEDFLAPGGTSEINRSSGAPRSLSGR